MSEDGKTAPNNNNNSFKIEISHFSNRNPNSERRSVEYNSEGNNKNLVTLDESQQSNTMKISIESKMNKKSTVSVRDGGEKIEIKIEKNNNNNSNKNSSRPKKVVKDMSAGNRLQSIDAGVSRRDAFGNLIKKGPGKKHRVSFSDNLNKSSRGQTSETNRPRFSDLVKTVEVESYKSFNVDISQDNLAQMRPNKSCCGKLCLIF